MRTVRYVTAGIMTVLIAAACASGPRSRAKTDAVVHVASTSELIAALQSGQPGRRIDLAAGDYPIEGPLTVPDGTTLAGAGVMHFDADGLPVGFTDGIATTLRVTAAFDGNVLTLGNGSRLERIRVLDLASPSAPSTRRRGNVLQVASRAPEDAIEASVVECELVNPNAGGFIDAGPTGGGVVLVTLNPGFEAPPAEHAGARISLDLRRSIVSARGASFLANNFASHGRIDARLEGNRLRGQLLAAGGTSRPEAVRDSVTQIESRGNLYAALGHERHGWALMGASSQPHFVDLPGSGAAHNLMRMVSTDDRIEGYPVGIRAVGARRVGADRQPLSDNRMELNIERARIRTEGDGAADLVFWATWSEIAQGEGPGDFPAGEGNVLHVRMSDSHGSGHRKNAFAIVSGPLKPENQGAGNRLEIEGRRKAFIESNRDLDPAPPDRFFLDR